MHVILTGATGLVGSAVLHAAVLNPSIKKISILSRRPVAQATATSEASQKCTVHLYSDFASPPPPDLLAHLKGAKGCVWALGVSVNDVDKDEYVRITYDYPLVFAKAVARQSEQPFNFVYVSGEGATTEPAFYTPRFGVVKGEAEAALLDSSKAQDYANLRVFSVRPGAVDSSQHQEIQDFIPKTTALYKKVLEKPMIAAFRTIYPGMVSPTRDMGQAMVGLAVGDGAKIEAGSGVSGEGRTLGNVALRKLSGI